MMSKGQASEKAVVGLQLLSLDDYIIMSNPERTNVITDLPIHLAITMQDKTQNFTHAFDVVKNVGALPMDVRHQQLMEGKALDPPFGLKHNLGPIDIQYLLATEPDGTRNLVKHLFIGMNKPRMLTSKLREAAIGEAYCLDCSKFKARRIIPKPFNISSTASEALESSRRSSTPPRSKRRCCHKPKLTMPSTISKRRLHGAMLAMKLYAGSSKQRTILRAHSSIGNKHKSKRRRATWQV